MSDKTITDLDEVASLQIRRGDLFETVHSSASKKVKAEGMLDQADLAPASANAFDDEFNDSATLPGGGSPLWTWDNQGGATAIITKGVLQLKAPAIGVTDAHRCLYQILPVTPWEFTCKVYLSAKTGVNYFFAGLALIESSTGKRITFDIGQDTINAILIQNWASNSSLTANLISDIFLSRLVYLRIADNTTNLLFSFSEDGITFFTVHSVSRTAFLASGANRIALLVNTVHATLDGTGSFHWFRRTV